MPPEDVMDVTDVIPEILEDAPTVRFLESIKFPDKIVAPDTLVVLSVALLILIVPCTVDVEEIPIPPEMMVAPVALVVLVVVFVWVKTELYVLVLPREGK